MKEQPVSGNKQLKLYLLSFFITLAVLAVILVIYEIAK
jgi:hypothetical protein